MKKMLLPLVAAALLAACGNKNDASGDIESDSTITSTPDSIAEPIVEEDTPLSLTFKEYSEHILFKADSDKRDLYHENTINVKWPVSCEGCDVKLIQAALRKEYNIKETDIQKYVNDWVKNTFADDSAPSYSIVKERLPERKDSEDDEEESDDEDCMPMYDTDCTVELYCPRSDEKMKVLTFCYQNVVNNGCGLGSCIFMYNHYMTYDYKNDKIVKLDDIIANQSLAAKELKKQCIFADEYGGLEGLREITELPDNFYIEGDTLVSVFQKYEISYGADGCPELGFDVRKNPKVLTEYGKKLFKLDDK